MSQLRMLEEEEEVPEGEAPEQTETTTESGSKKRKRPQSDRSRGDRGTNKWPANTYRVTELNARGQPIAPKEVPPKFRNAIGFLVRDKLDITISKWKDVSDDTKKDIWDTLCTRFIFPQGSEDLARKFAMSQTATSFRNWRYEMHTK